MGRFGRLGSFSSSDTSQMPQTGNIVTSFLFVTVFSQLCRLNITWGRFALIPAFKVKFQTSDICEDVVSSGVMRALQEWCMFCVLAKHTNKAFAKIRGSVTRASNRRCFAEWHRFAPTAPNLHNFPHRYYSPQLLHAYIARARISQRHRLAQAFQYQPQLLPFMVCSRCCTQACAGTRFNTTGIRSWRRVIHETGNHVVAMHRQKMSRG